MKTTIKVAALVLTMFPMAEFARAQSGQPSGQADSNRKMVNDQRPDSYFASVPMEIQRNLPHHILASKDSSTISSREARLAKATNELLSAHLSAAQALQNFRSIQEDTAQPLRDASSVLTRLPAAHAKPPAKISSPEVNPVAFATQDIIKPSPVNSLPGSAEQPVAPQVLQTPNAVEPQQVTAFEGGEMPGGDDSVSQINGAELLIDAFQQRQPTLPWAEKQNTMRNIGDQFSPGGTPFAFKGVVGNPNFFGIDRRQCCDEWANHCNCNGLKVNRGHLGLPWLRSPRDSCEPSRPIGAKRRGCGCDNTCSN